jgi:hypothetical protein
MRTTLPSHSGLQRLNGIWEKYIPELTQWTDTMPPVKFGIAELKKMD